MNKKYLKQQDLDGININISLVLQFIYINLKTNFCFKFTPYQKSYTFFTKASHEHNKQHTNSLSYSMILQKFIPSMKPFTWLNQSSQINSFALRKYSSMSFAKMKINSGKQEKSGRWWVKYALGVPLLAGFGIYQYTKYNFLKYEVPEEDVAEPQIYDEVKVSNRFVRLIKYILRFLHLSIIFLPSILSLPLALFQTTLDYWMQIFLWSIQNAGVVWIKAFQYLSHRRDVIGPQMAQKFSCLRQNSPAHPEIETQKIFKRVYGVNPDQMFDQFDHQAIASGSISQVYKAKLQGKKVALKVRHPNVEKNIERDIDILFFFSRVFSKISNHFEIPIKNESLKKILIDQVYLTRECKNLKRFNKIFKTPEVSFPVPHPQTNDQVLIESFSQGLPITFYSEHPHKLNKAIAMIGASAFFEMMMKHNFVHADCHGGNIYVRIEPNQKWYQGFKDQFKNLQNWIISQVTQNLFDSPLLKKLAEENYQYEKNVYELLQKSNSRVQITLLDVGMVINLNESKKKAFRQFLRQVLKGNSKQCARMVYNLSLKGDKQLQQLNILYTDYLRDLQKMFLMINKTNLADLEGIDVLHGMLGVIRKHSMKIDGEISILFTNMLVLQAIAKQLDPDINILRCVIPFLVHQGIEEIKHLQLPTSSFKK